MVVNIMMIIQIIFIYVIFFGEDPKFIVSHSVTLKSYCFWGSLHVVIDRLKVKGDKQVEEWIVSTTNYKLRIAWHFPCKIG